MKSFLFILFLGFGAGPSPLHAQGAAASSTMVAESPEEKIARLLEIHYVKAGLKTPFDSVSITGSDARVRVWRDLPTEPDPERVECVGYQWLLGGRGTKMGAGASEVFKQNPSLATLTLEFIDLTKSSKPVDGKGKLKTEFASKVYFSAKVSRDRLSKTAGSASQWKAALTKDQESCLRIGRQVVLTKEVNL